MANSGQLPRIMHFHVWITPVVAQVRLPKLPTEHQQNSDMNNKLEKAASITTKKNIKWIGSTADCWLLINNTQGKCSHFFNILNLQDYLLHEINHNMFHFQIKLLRMIYVFTTAQRFSSAVCMCVCVYMCLRAKLNERAV